MSKNKIEKSTKQMFQDFTKEYNQREQNEKIWKIGFFVIFFSILIWISFMVNDAFIAVNKGL